MVSELSDNDCVTGKMRLRNILCSIVYNHDLGPFGPWVLYFAFRRSTWFAPVRGIWADEGRKVSHNPAASPDRFNTPDDLWMRLAAELDLIDQIGSKLSSQR
jgi:hypothetical protein